MIKLRGLKNLTIAKLEETKSWARIVQNLRGPPRQPRSWKSSSTKSPLAHPPRLPAVETGWDFVLFRSCPLNCFLLSGICCGKWCWTRWEIKFTRNLVTLHNKAARFCKSDQIQFFLLTDLFPKKLSNWSKPINSSNHAMFPYFTT